MRIFRKPGLHAAFLSSAARMLNRAFLVVRAGSFNCVLIEIFEAELLFWRQICALFSDFEISASIPSFKPVQFPF